MAVVPRRVVVDDRLTDADRWAMLRHQARSGLTGFPKDLSAVWCFVRYCDGGKIKHLQELERTQGEQALLERDSHEIAAAATAENLVHLALGDFRLSCPIRGSVLSG